MTKIIVKIERDGDGQFKITKSIRMPECSVESYCERMIGQTVDAAVDKRIKEIIRLVHRLGGIVKQEESHDLCTHANGVPAREVLRAE